MGYDDDAQRNMAWAAQAAKFCNLHGYVKGTRRWDLLDREVAKVALAFPGWADDFEQTGDDILERAHANLVADGLAPTKPAGIEQAREVK